MTLRRHTFPCSSLLSGGASLRFLRLVGFVPSDWPVVRVGILVNLAVRRDKELLMLFWLLAAGAARSAGKAPVALVYGAGTHFA